MWSQSRYLYVAEFKNGVVKIGMARNARTRTVALRSCRYRISRVHVCARSVVGFWPEKQMISRLRRIAITHEGREWFTGIRFSAVCHLANQITRRALRLGADTPNVSPQGCISPFAPGLCAGGVSISCARCHGDESHFFVSR